ncbi:MAG: response regulator transcription factor [Deltaproteobacteria bacterium]|nr:response regulator transcription factor [Deltaproteobacteria bacterium]
MNGTHGRGETRSGETVLVIEDDRSLREGLAMNFALQGYRAVTARDGEEGLVKALEARPDLIVLDVMLPGASGLEILAELRQRGQDVPVLILSARGGTGQKVEGLRLGADDYLGKPFELPELLARVEALLRRRRTDAAAPIRFGDVEIDPARRRVTVAGAEVSLSAKEYELLQLLARSPGRPFTREHILEQVWGWNFDGTARTVDNFILALRHKIEADPARPRHLKTVRQIGYKLEP